MYKKSKIEIFSRNIGFLGNSFLFHPYQHLFLVYTAGLEEPLSLSAGPGGKLEVPYSKSLKYFIGDIFIKVEKYQEGVGSNDYKICQESKCYSSVVAEGDFETILPKWSKIVSRAEEINKASVKYSVPFCEALLRFFKAMGESITNIDDDSLAEDKETLENMPPFFMTALLCNAVNSNSVIRDLLEFAEIELKLPTYSDGAIIDAPAITGRFKLEKLKKIQNDFETYKEKAFTFAHFNPFNFINFENTEKPDEEEEEVVGPGTRSLFDEDSEQEDENQSDKATDGVFTEEDIVAKEQGKVAQVFKDFDDPSLYEADLSNVQRFERLAEKARLEGRSKDAAMYKSLGRGTRQALDFLDSLETKEGQEAFQEAQQEVQQETAEVLDQVNKISADAGFQERLKGWQEVAFDMADRAVQAQRKMQKEGRAPKSPSSDPVQDAMDIISFSTEALKRAGVFFQEEQEEDRESGLSGETDQPGEL